MTINDYQEWTRSTAIYPKYRALDYLISALCAEAGEVAGKYAKIIRDTDGKMDAQKAYEIVLELGDVFWEAVRIADELGWDARDILIENMNKLEMRKQRGVLSGSGDNR